MIDPRWHRARAIRVVLQAAERVAVRRGWDPTLSRVVDYLAEEYDATLRALTAPPAMETPQRWTEAEEVIWRALVAELEGKV